MNKSETLGKLAKALSLVQSQLRPAKKDSANPFFKSSYADLNSVWDACRDLLAANGLSVAQVNQPAESGVIVETVLMHESGEWIGGEIFLPLAKHDPQGVGSAITYGRRYGLAAMVGIVADEDDDGNAATRPQQKQPAKAQAQAPTQNSNAGSLRPMADRIASAKDAIEKLGGQVEAQGKNETQEQYLESLAAQYKRLKG